MPKQISTEEFDTLLQVISGFPSGVSLREIKKSDPGLNMAFNSDTCGAF
jgi:hypothetical protein